MTGQIKNVIKPPSSVNKNSIAKPAPSTRNDGIKNTALYQILSKKERNKSTLLELNKALEVDSNKAFLNHKEPALDGDTMIHILTKTASANEDISWRMAYALANSGANVNVQDNKGNTPLHLAYMRGYLEVGFKFIEALLKIGADFEIKNNNNKIAFNYMEDIEQLNSMYDSHFPNLWKAVELGQAENVQRLMNAWVKASLKKNDISLLELAAKNKTISKTIETYYLSTDFVHALFALDENRMKKLLKSIGTNFDPNMADFSYCFTWFKPVCRNLPRFLLEVALESGEDDIIKLVLSTNCDVNFLDSKTGDPFYFRSYEKKFRNFKVDLIKNADFSIKNHTGQNVLFHLVKLYNIETDNTIQEALIQDFRHILANNPILIAHRDQENLALIETIMTLEPDSYNKSLVFLKEISDLIKKLIQNNSLDIIQEMIYQSYGLVLMKTPIFPKIESKNESLQSAIRKAITFEQYIIDNDLKEIKNYLRKSFENDFLYRACAFIAAIKIGDFNSVKKYLVNQEDLFLLAMRDFSGRSCLHLAVLYGQTTIGKYFLQLEPNLKDAIDNVGRSALHYAYALKDSKMIEILLYYKIDQNIRDSKFLLADEYQNEEIINDEWFGIKNFRDNEIKNCNAVDSFVKCFVYSHVKKAIMDNNEDELKQINERLKVYDLSLKNLPFWFDNSFVNGEAYIPPLELAMDLRSFTAFRYILESTVKTKARLLSARSVRPKSVFSVSKSIDMNLTYLREKAEDEEMDEIIDILDTFEEDNEIAILNRQNSSLTIFETQSKKKKNETVFNDIIINPILKKQSMEKSKKNIKSDYLNRKSDPDQFDNNSKLSRLCTIL